MIVSLFHFLLFTILSSSEPNTVGPCETDAEKLIAAYNVPSSVSGDSSLFEAFTFGLRGFEYFRDEQILSNYLIVVDFTKPSSEQRFFVFDVEKKVLVRQSLVAHGKNSGMKYATRFSNQIGSNTSSLGFYRTAETYHGKHGLSLRLDGLENGINNNARERAIVIHSAAYASEDFVERHGRLGRSFGCPSLPKENFTETIDLIKDGALLYIHYPDKEYLKGSRIFPKSS